MEGIVRAKQDMLDKGGEGGFTVLPIMMHGDAAFAGQGVVAETLNLSQLRGYRTGGTVHIVVNNQLGFTTAPRPRAGPRQYATDVARMIQAPIFHVNGDDPEAVVRVGRLAFEFRQTFHKDVVIDLVCYRRRGHNEADNPSFTQPLMYDLIEAKRSTRKLYTESLIGRGDITMEEAEAALRDYQRQLERAFAETREAAQKPPEPGAVRRPEPEERPVNHTAVPTAISLEVVKRIIETQVTLPDGFTPHPRLQPQLARRSDMITEDTIDWAIGELLAFGGLLLDSHPVRLVGQDSRRGTFGQRHAVVVDRHNGNEYTPLKRFDHGSVQVLRLRLAAVRVRRDGLRVRLLGGPAGRPGGLGGPVRRLLQRRPDRSSTSSSARASRSGASTPAWSCCCRTATRARARTTPRPGSSGSCPCARRTT